MIATIQMVRQCAREWLTAPEARIAGRLGLFRVIYALFYLWHLSWVNGATLSLFPDAVWQPVYLLQVVPLRPATALPGMLESSLVAALVMLLAGLWVRPITLAVLVLGTLVEAFHQSFGNVERASVFLVFYLPLFMLGSEWGSTWSLDALVARRAGRTPRSPSDDSWRLALPMRGVLIMLVLLFLSAVVAKYVLGDWLTAPDRVANLLLSKNMEAVLAGLRPCALWPFVVATPLMWASFRVGVLLFEGSFVLVLLGGQLRAAYLAAALIFQALCALLLAVTFTPILIVYALFVDWQTAVARITPRMRWLGDFLEGVPPGVLTSGVLVLAALAGWSWNLTPTLRRTLQLGGWLDWRTIWLPVLPLAIVWWLRASLALLKTGRRSATGGGAPTLT